MSTPFGGYPSHKLVENQLANTKHNRMENVLLSDITVCYEELVISRAYLDEIIIRNNQESASIDRQVHCD